MYSSETGANELKVVPLYFGWNLIKFISSFLDLIGEKIIKCLKVHFWGRRQVVSYFSFCLSSH